MPPNDGSANIVFFNSSNYNSQIDTAGWYINTLLLDGPTYHLSGGILLLQSGLTNSANAQYIANAVFSANDQTWQDYGALAFTGEVNPDDYSTLTLEANHTTTFSGHITGTSLATIDNNGPGTVLLNALNSFSGNWQLNSGVVKLGNGGGFQNASVYLNEANAIDFNSLATATIGGLNGTFGLNYGATNLNFNGAGTYGADLSGTGLLGRVGSGDEALWGQNTVGGMDTQAGSITLNASTTTVNGQASIGGSSELDVAFGATLNVGGNALVVSDGKKTPVLDVTGAGTTVNAGTFITGQQGAGQSTIEKGGVVTATTTIVGDYAGWTSSLTVENLGSALNTTQLALGSDGIHSGGTGNVLISNFGEVTAFDTYLAGFSTLTINGGLLTTQILNGIPSTTIALANSTYGPDLVVAGTTDSEFDGQIIDATGGGGSISKVSTSTLTLTGPNTFTGTTYVHYGTLIQHGGANYSAFQVDPTATLIFDNNAVADTDTRTINNQGQTFFNSGNINYGTMQGSGEYWQNGTSNFYQTILNPGATFVQNGTVTSTGFYMAGNYINNGTHTAGFLSIASGANFQDNGKVTSKDFNGNYGTLNIAPGASWFNQGQFIAGGVSTTAVFGTLDLGGGTLEAEGTTFVVDGTVQNGTVQVWTEMHGTGNMPGGYEWESGTLSFGDGHPGTLSSGTATWGGNILVLQLNDAVGSPGANWSNTLITGDLNVTAPIDVMLETLRPDNTSGLLADFNANQNYLWTFATVSGNIGGGGLPDFLFDTSQFTNATHGTFSVVENGNTLAIQYIASPVPTPSSLACLGIGVVGFLIRRRRR